MNLDEYVAKHGQQRGGSKCGVCALPADLRALIDRSRGTYTARTIAAWLTEEKKRPTKKTTVERHLREHTK